MRPCATIGCPLPHHARGRCARHYWRARRATGWRQVKKRPGGRPRKAQRRAFGFAASPTTKNRTLVPEEGRVVRLLFRLYLRLQDARRCAAALNERGERTRNGRPWCHTSVLWILSRPWGVSSRFVYRSVWERAEAIRAWQPIPFRKKVPA